MYIRVTHNRKVHYIKTDKVVDQKGVAKDKGIKDPFVLKYCSSQISRYVNVLNNVDVSSWSIDEVISYMKSGSSDVCFSDYAREYQSKMIQEGHDRNSSMIYCSIDAADIPEKSQTAFPWWM